VTYQKKLGDQGEEIAVNYLKDKDYQIVERQWSCQFGEIDIIAKKQMRYIFVEVKSCKGHNVEFAFANLTQRKQERFINTVQTYLAENQLDQIIWRIDAIGIAIPAQGTPIIEHVEDAFDW